MTGKLIGIGGKLASGKDTVADYLVEEHGWVKLNMSGPLRDALRTLNPWIPVQYEFASGHWRYADLEDRIGYTAAKENPEVRRLLQTLGTEVGRKMIDENLWVELAGKSIDFALEQGYDVVITGIRFPNEFSMIKNRGGTTLWVSRIGHEVSGSHDSENSVSFRDFDKTIQNNGTIQDLYEKTDWTLSL